MIPVIVVLHQFADNVDLLDRVYARGSVISSFMALISLLLSSHSVFLVPISLGDIAQSALEPPLVSM